MHIHKCMHMHAHRLIYTDMHTHTHINEFKKDPHFLGSMPESSTHMYVVLTNFTEKTLEN